MSRFFSGLYAELEPYVPGEQPRERKYIKLNTNESPFPPSPAVLQALSEETVNRLNLYPDPEVSVLRESIAKHYSLKKENVFTANGSDDVIAFSIMAFCGRGGKLACPDVTYGFYPVYARLFGVDLREIPLKEDFSVDPADYFGLDSHIIIANPNAPTGMVLTTEQIESILRANPDRLVMIDEAYMDFCGEGCDGLIGQYDNLLVIRTYSKSRSLAGLRVGYALGSAALIADLETIRFSFNPYNINSLTMAAATAAMEDNEYYDGCIAEIVAGREKTAEVLRALGFTVLDSRANFLFVSHPDYAAKELYSGLKERGILVRYFEKQRINNFLRITVGSEADMDAVVTQLREILKG